MKKIILLDCEKNREKLLELLPLISESRRKRFFVQKKEADRLHTVGGEVLLSRLLSLPLPLNIEARKDGKPLIKGSECFSLSHSGKWVAAIKDGCEVGIDIEEASRFSEKITSRILNQNEMKIAETKSGDELKNYLCKIWVMKESYLKMTGEGLRKDMRTLDLSPADFFFYNIDGYILSASKKDCEVEFLTL